MRNEIFASFLEHVGICFSWWKTSRYSKYLISSNVLSIYWSHTDWHSVYGYSYNITSCLGWEWSENILKIVYNYNDIPCAFLACINCFCRLNMPCPFWFSLPAAISYSSLDVTMLFLRTKIALLLKNRIFSLKHRGERLCILHFNNKKGRGGLRKSSLQRIKGAQKSLKNGIFLNRENIFPQHCYRDSV